MASNKESVVPSDLFPHVYAFLLECNLIKAAKSLKKECKVVSQLLKDYEDVQFATTWMVNNSTASPDSEGPWTNAVLSALSNKVGVQYRSQPLPLCLWEVHAVNLTGRGQH